MDGLNNSTFIVDALALLVLEVDGVLTDGQSWPDASGTWRRRFSVRDSIALRALRRSGVKIAILTRSSSADIHAHAELVGIDACVVDCDDKPAALRALCARFAVEPKSVAAIIESDDDAWMARELGWVIATPGAGPGARQAAGYVTNLEGGDGAVREACNFLRVSQREGARLKSAVGAR
jgi:3-deoxy-D-manno-octulosonate 8-phosphate phosphatase (KDO 8-P phosphatase)